MRLRYFPVVIMAIFLAIGSLSSSCKAQVFNPVKWEFASKHLEGDKYEIQFIANIEPHWHLYSQKVGKNGPIPTSFVFAQSDQYSLIGKTNEPEGITLFEPMFKMEVKYFENKAVFTQKIKIKSDDAVFKGDLEFMACDDEKCLPPEIVDFQIPVVASSDGEKTNPTAEASKANPISESIASGSVSKLNTGNLTMANTSEATAEGTTSEEMTTEPSHNGANSGILTPVTWSHKVVNHEDGTYTVSATATIESHWHVYSKDLPKDDGPVATEFNILTKEGIELVGGVNEEGELETEHDPNFDMVLNYYSNTVTFSQRIKPTADMTSVKAEVYFMTCNAETCIPPEAVEFDYDLTTAEIGAPAEVTASTGESEEEGEGKSLWGIIALSFLGGFAALLTPCVFPMIPMTVSFFTKQSKTKAAGIRNAIIYGASIIGIYVILGVGVSVTFGADALNALSTNVWFNLFFFVLLIVFATSFLGAFEITLPSSWVNKADTKADQGGLIGIFFMAFVLALVSFSCTGPIIGTLLVEAAVNGGYMGPILGMLAFSSALALPFALFAMFPGWMNSLPKSGGWLNTVKVVLGFLELALAFKFLSNADLVLQAGWLPREMFLAVWITIFGALAIYLFGWIKLPHDSPLDGISVGRLMMAIVVTWFTIYLIPGMWGAPLKLISGFPPPMFYSESPNGVGYKGGTAVISASHEGDLSIPKGAEPDHCPYNINCFHDYDQGMAYAKEVGLPVMLDFTGWACVNCRKMEEQVWSDPHVLEMLKNDFVLISLYVDEKTKLPESEQYTSPTTGKKVKTIGNKWSDMQIREYNTNAQPYYVVIDHEENQLHESAAYDPDIAKYVEWLERGKKLFHESK